MPFGLKNTGATYQRLVNKMFENQVGKSMEVYIDDMLVKSLCAEDYLTHLQENFDILRSYNMKLNPEKCAFGVGSGIFLGFMVSNRRIKINPDKIKDIKEITVVNNVKAVQRLTGRIAALGRFISRSSDKSHHFFALLKRKKNFEWTLECQHTLEELKRYLSSPPLLHTPKEDETLYLYLVVSEITVNGVLVREEQASCQLIPSRIYYINLLSGRLAKWAIELEGYDIEYQPRIAIKSQILADFVADFSPTLVPEVEKELLLKSGTSTGVWTLFTDGATSIRGSGLGLELAKSLGAETVEAKCDSLLMVIQVNGSYEAREDRMQSPKSDQSGLLLGQHGKRRQGIRPKMQQVSEVRSHDSLARGTTAFRFITMAIHEMGDGHYRPFADSARGNWRETMPNVLWAYRTTPKSSTRETPFSLVYGAEALIPVEAEEPSTIFRHTSEGSNNEAMAMTLELLDERQEASLVRMAAQKHKVKRYYNRRTNLRYFGIGDLVLRKVTLNTKNPNKGKLG
uniref:Uncharacterized protein LOC104211652 n=1 Tax=Nicotiana sylvestris TaxID=4096 RepID=A0A1U7UY09_NICSY|nr:PREDICTED: uncharacterized protein LOC104211652 [Nicotiana sylvestris]